MDLTFLGAVQTVTGSKYLLSFDNKNILIDCGLYQGLKELRERNWNPLPISAKAIDAVILTHAHIDHSGYLPLLVKHGFRGKIYSTEGTKDLCSILLPDSGHIQEAESEIANRYGYSKHSPALPLYTQEDGENTIQYFHTLPYHKSFQLTPDFSFELLPAGHIVGSAMVRIHYKNKTVVFTGDLGRPNDPVMKAPDRVDEADYLVIESTYGNRLHESAHPKDLLKEIVNKTIKRGGTILIPSFAVGRAQALLHYIFTLKKEKAIPDIPVFLDSPMSIDSTQILLKYHHNLRLTEAECAELNKVATYTCSPEESKSIDENPMPKIIISASGMATGGRILFHLARYAPDHRNTILFTGYQAGGTRGARLMNGEKELKIHGKMVPVNAEVAALSNTSAHVDYAEMLQWLSVFKKSPKKIFITHGEENAANALKEKIEKQFHWRCVVPQYMQKEMLE